MKTAHPNFQFSIFKFQSTLQIKNFKLKIISLLLILYFLFSASPVLAQTNPYASPNTNSNVPSNLHNYTQNVLIEITSALTCQLIGIDPINPKSQCLGIDVKTGRIGFTEQNPEPYGMGQNPVLGTGGALGFMTNMISVLYTPPASSIDYFKYLSQNFGIAKPVYAQTGFESIKPLASIWAVFRNITYLLFVVVFIMVGLAIMLRVKIDPRTVMSIENQIPKIIISLILVTFSFAIAGFLIDIMWLSIYLILNIFSSADPLISAGIVNSKIHEPPVGFVNEIFKPQSSLDLGGVLEIARNSAFSIQNIISNMLAPRDTLEYLNLQNNAAQKACPSGFLTFDPKCWLNVDQIIKDSILTLLSQVFGFIVSWLIASIAFLVIIIAILWALLRLWFALLKAFVFILIDIIFAPFWIITGFIPGGPGFTGWLRDLGANLVAFPAAIGMFLLGKALMDAFSQINALTFVPPLIGNPLGGEQAGSFSPLSFLIGLGIILMTPQVVAMMQDFLKSPQFKYTAAIGEAIGAGSSSSKNIFQTAMMGKFGGSKPGESGLGAVAKKMIGI